MPKEFVCRRPHMVFESSGTTGRNKRIYLTQDELEEIGKFNARDYFSAGPRSRTGSLIAFDFLAYGYRGIVTQRGIDAGKFFGLARKDRSMEVYSRIPTYNFNIIMGEPTWLIKLTEIAEKHGSYPLKFLIGRRRRDAPGQQPGPWMEKVWQGREGPDEIYGTVESSGIAGLRTGFPNAVIIT